MRTRAALVVVFLSLSGQLFIPQMVRSCVECFGIEPGTQSCRSALPFGGTSCTLTSSHCFTSGSCGPGGCFLDGTLVETPRGPQRIEDIQVGDAVLGVDENGDRVFNTVTGVTRSLANEYYVLNGATKVTSSHPFLVGERWVTMDELRVGDTLEGSDGSVVDVFSISIVDWGVRTVNLSVSGNHTFFANGVLVHNKEGDPNDDI